MDASEGLDSLYLYLTLSTVSCVNLLLGLWLCGFPIGTYDNNLNALSFMAE